MPKTNCIYVACSKNACSLIKSELYRIEHGSPYPKYQTPHNRLATGFVSPADMPEQRFYDLLRDHSVPKIGFVRDPFKRVVSCYRNRLGSLGMEPYDIIFNTRTEWIVNRQKILAHKYGTRITYQRAISEKVTLEDFIRFICQQHPYEMDRHWYYQSHSLFVDRIDYDYIGMVETLSASLNHVANLIGAPADYHFDGRRLNKSKWSSADLSLEQEPFEMFQGKFAEDYELIKNVKEKFSGE
ncbi:MAG: sulfotransferase family protein [Proteobacteria bacterium]|nr:sulfotransferase family protein [Pseudomonadota bacterium]MBU1060666.1 sulfotransferase family protein [Pseudomonadota bacterium]